MNVPEGHPRIAQRFNAGWASAIGVESRRDGRNSLPNRRACFRPFGACSGWFVLPTVETVGYSHSPLAGLAACRLAAKQRAAAADVSALERELDELVSALYGLTPEEIQIVEGTAK